jgi:hypothetical protein
MQLTEEIFHKKVKKYAKTAIKTSSEAARVKLVNGA